jgi:signal transduction histidine kinase
MMAVEERQMGQTLVNVTGVMGAVAVPLNLVCVLYLTGPGEPAWVKLAAFVVAILYGNSGILNVLLDCTVYSVRQRVPRFVTLLRPYAWLLAGAALAAMVGVSVALGRWSTGTEPAAWLACGLTYVIGMKVREYDRFLRVSGERARDAMTKARERLAHDVHDQFTGIRSFSKDLYFDDTVNPDSKMLAVDLGTFTKEVADEQKWMAQGGQTSFPGMIGQLESDLERNIRSELRFGELSQGNRDLARQLITTLVSNAAQALRGDPDARISVTGLVADELVHVRVGDPLPTIPDDCWCREGSTMAVVRERLRARGGDLTQTSTDAGKQICGVWPVKPPLIRRTSKR